MAKPLLQGGSFLSVELLLILVLTVVPVAIGVILSWALDRNEQDETQ